MPNNYIGKVIRLKCKIGSGACGEVFLATRTDSRDSNTLSHTFPPRFVVKIIKVRSWKPDSVKRVHCELLLTKKLIHPFIVPYLSTWIESGANSYKGCYCIAMFYCNGGDMRSYMQRLCHERAVLPETFLVRLMLQVFSALEYSHSMRVIHRDIKPENVFLYRNSEKDTWSVMIGDYGVARPLANSMQLVHTFVGTPFYCSPEIVLGSPYSTGTDVFSAGVMFFEVMTLEKPFGYSGCSRERVFNDIVNKDPLPILHRFRNIYDHFLINIIERCLEKAEKNRPSARDVCSALCWFASTCKKCRKQTYAHSINFSPDVNDKGIIAAGDDVHRRESPPIVDPLPVSNLLPPSLTKKCVECQILKLYLESYAPSAQLDFANRMRCSPLVAESKHSILLDKAVQACEEAFNCLTEETKQFKIPAADVPLFALLDKDVRVYILVKRILSSRRKRME